MDQKIQSGVCCKPLKGTVTPKHPFDVDKDCLKLRDAMKGLRTNEKVIIMILSSVSNAQRQELKNKYQQIFGKDLVETLKSELRGDFEDLVKRLMMPPCEYDAYCLYKAMKGHGTTESTLIEILVTRSNNEIQKIKNVFEDKYGGNLEVWISDDTSGDFEQLMLSLAKGQREAKGQVDLTEAFADAERLRKAGIARLGTDKKVFITIMASRSFAQLRAIFDAYHKIAKEDIAQSIKKKFSGNLKTSLLAIVDTARCISNYFAKQLHCSMAGLGTNDTTLIRVVVTRSEIDMVNIKSAYRELYKKDLSADIKGDTSGDYCKLLLELVAGN